jgi:hypothetical protein
VRRRRLGAIKKEKKKKKKEKETLAYPGDKCPKLLSALS